VEHDGQAVGPLGVGRQPEVGAAGLDALLGAADALGHRRLGDQEGPGDLGGREPADRPEGQRQLGRRRQLGVAAQEQQGERVIPVAFGRAGIGRVALAGRGRRLPGRGDVLAAAPGRLAAGLVGEPPRGHRDQPAPRVVGDPFLRPLPRGGEQRLLHRVLAGVEPA
jgi:hypothetical protein